MQHRFSIFFLLFSLFVAMPTNRVWACGNCETDKHAQTSSEKSCCEDSDDKNAAHCAAKTDACGQQHPGQKCPDSKGSGGCHCPCGTVMGSHAGGMLADFPLEVASISTSSDATLRQAFYFAQHMPEAVYLPIWQPPKLGV